MINCKKPTYNYKSTELRQYNVFKDIKQLNKYGISPIYDCLRFAEFIIILTTYSEITKIIGKANIRKNKSFKDDDIVVCTVGYDGFVFVEDIFTEKGNKETKELDGEFVFVNYSKVKHYMLKHLDKNSFLFLYDVEKDN